MKLRLLILGLGLITFVSCGDSKNQETKKQEAPVQEDIDTKSEGKYMEYKGVGPVKSLNLPVDIDQNMAKKGESIFKAKCTACHKVHKQFIGPNPTGITKRRSPEWIMNMILNPEKMITEDPIAKQLLMDFNGAPMANQNLSQEEARQVLEYFRTLK